jgi:hypothetical protein
MKRFIKIWLGGYVVVMASYYSAAWIFRSYGKFYHGTLSGHQRVYCYDTLSKGTLNTAYFAHDIADTTLLRNYYEGGDRIMPSSDGFAWSMEGIVIRYVGSDSSFAEIVVFDTTCYGWEKGYLHRLAFHPDPPPRAKVEANERWWKEYQQTNSSYYIRYKPSTCLSSYGFWCGCK